MTNRISLSALWEDSVAFVRREFALLLPVALLGFGAPVVILLLAVPVEQAEAGRILPGPWMGWLIPCGLLSLVGTLTVSALALSPGASVGECLRLAGARLPAGIGLFLLNIAFQLVLTLPILLLTALQAAISGGEGAGGALPTLGNFAVIAVMIWLFVRAMPIWALLADRGGQPWATVRACFALTRGHYRLLLAVRLVATFAGAVALAVVLVPLGALAALLGVLSGANALTVVLSYLFTALAVAALAALWTVFVARLYRGLASSGT